jgi:hypothetical protein
MTLKKVHIKENGWALLLFFERIEEAVHAEVSELLKSWVGSQGSVRFLSDAETATQTMQDIEFRGENQSNSGQPEGGWTWPCWPAGHTDANVEPSQPTANPGQLGQHPHNFQWECSPSTSYACFSRCNVASFDDTPVAAGLAPSHATNPPARTCQVHDKQSKAIQNKKLPRWPLSEYRDPSSSQVVTGPNCKKSQWFFRK